MSVTLLTGGIGPIERQWEDFRGAVLDARPEPHDDPREQLAIFLSGASAMLTLMVAADADWIALHGDLKRLTEGLKR